MIKLLEIIDLFGYKINFIFKYGIAYSSIFSYVISLLVYSMLIFLVYYFSKDMIRHENPKVSFIENNFDDKIVMGLENFTENIEVKLMATFEKTLSGNWGSSNKTQFQLFDYLKAQNISLHDIFEMKLLISNSDNELVLGESESEFLSIKQTLDFSYNSKISVEGNSVELKNKMNSDSNYIMTELLELMSKNGTKLNTKERKYKDLFMRDFRLNITKDTKLDFYFSIKYDLLIDLNLSLTINKFDRRLQTWNSFINQNDVNFFSLRNQEKYLESGPDPTYYNQMKYTYGFYEIKDDRNWIFSWSFDEMKSFHRANVDTTRVEIQDSMKKMSLLLMNFLSTKKSYFRVFKKLQNVFADLGGIFSSLLMMGRIIVFTVNKKMFDYDAINFLFRMDEDHFENNHGKANGVKNDLNLRLKTASLCKLKILDVNKKNFFAKSQNNIENQSYENYKNKSEFSKEDKKNVNNNQKIINENKFDNLNNSNFSDLNKELSTNRIEVHDNSELWSLSFKKLHNQTKNFNFKKQKFEINKESINESKLNQNSIERNEIQAIESQLPKTISLSKAEISVDLQDRSLGNKPKQHKSDGYIIKLNNNKNNFYQEKKNLNDHGVIHEKEISAEIRDVILREKIKTIIEKITKIKNKSNIRNIHCDLNEKKLMSFSNLDFLKSFLCCSKIKAKELIKKEKIFENAQKKIYEYLNVLNYFNVYEELEKLKKIVLNKHQNVLFNFTRNRSIYEISNDETENDLYNTIRHLKENKHILNDSLVHRIVDECSEEFIRLLLD